MCYSAKTAQVHMTNESALVYDEAKPYKTDGLQPPGFSRYCSVQCKQRLCPAHPHSLDTGECSASCTTFCLNYPRKRNSALAKPIMPGYFLIFHDA